MLPRVWINRLKFSDGSSIDIGKNDITVIVGPNNAGKSEGLRAIRNKLSVAQDNPVIIDIGLDREGTDEELLEWINSFAKVSEPYTHNPTYRAYGAGINKNQALSWWKSEGSLLHGMARFFCHLLSAEERLNAAKPAPRIAILSEPPTHPIHELEKDDRQEKKLSEQFHRAFGVDLVVNRAAGNQVPLHVGQRPVPGPDQDRLSYEYLEKIGQLPTILTQGDGMRSFAGVLLSTSVGRESILLIDEPEAFLHPPQARLLGRMLAEDKPTERQLFVATHSGDILRGFLDVGSTDVRVVRIRRIDEKNHVRQLDNEKITELWSDPLLRYSNILDGLFHEKVVVCEGDADARFYSAITDAAIESIGADAKRPDIMFTHCGGKDRLALVIRALREVDVPIAAVVDFDVLNNEKPLRNIVEAAGLDWSSICADWKRVKTAIDTKKPELSAFEVKKDIEKILSSVSEGTFPDIAKKSIQKIFRRSTPWATAKDVGKDFVPPGDPTKAYLRLNKALKKFGIFIVEVGEVESFDRTVGNHGPKWVNEVLKKDLAADSGLEEARRFVKELIPL